MTIWIVFQFFFLTLTRKVNLSNRKRICMLHHFWICYTFLNIDLKNRSKKTVSPHKRIFISKGTLLNSEISIILKEIFVYFLIGRWFLRFLYLRTFRSIFQFFHKKRKEFFPLSF